MVFQRYSLSAKVSIFEQIDKTLWNG